MTIILFDTPQSRKALYPFTPTRPVCDIRHGILTIREKWQLLTGLPVFSLTDSYLLQPIMEDESYLYIDATVIPTPAFIVAVQKLRIESLMEFEGNPVVIKSKQSFTYPIITDTGFKIIELKDLGMIRFPWQLFQTNETAIKADFYLLTNNKTSEPIDPTNVVFGKENVFIETGVTVRACIINADDGPVYIGKNALVMEGTTIRGPVSIGENAVVKMGAKLYAGTSIGPKCTAGGEIKNSILMGHSNKAHDGYLGDSVIGEWCNLGAGTTNSNIKNTAGIVKMWNNELENFTGVGIKAGLLMGDYSRTAINTSFNTGTVVGTCCNIFTTGFPPKHIPSFTWGNDKYDLEKAIADIGRWKKFKGVELGEKEIEMIAYLYKPNGLKSVIIT